jgi:cytosine deaminase
MGEMDDRTTDDSAAARWLDAAIEQAEKSWREGGIPIGCVLVDPRSSASSAGAPGGAGTIIARGHNMRVQSNDPTAHAEVVCIRNAGRRRDWRHLTLVSTLSPCPMCSGTAILFKIPRVIIGENHTFVGAEDWLQRNGVDVRVLNDPRCVALMERLKREKPDLWAEDIGE